MRQSYWVTETVNFPFAFVDTRLHFGHVIFPLAYFGEIFIKSICIRIQQNTFGLAVDYSFYQFCQFFIFFYKRNIRPDLGCTITQPHCINISGDYISIRFSIYNFKINCSIQRVWKTVFKQPRQFRICNLFFNSGNCCLYRRTCKFPFC
ncbi:hypothetical protein D3C86_602470 [compost metagenome]